MVLLGQIVKFSETSAAVVFAEESTHPLTLGSRTDDGLDG